MLKAISSEFKTKLELQQFAIWVKIDPRRQFKTIKGVRMAVIEKIAKRQSEQLFEDYEKSFPEVKKNMSEVDEGLIDQWQEKTRHLKELKFQEMKLRKQIVNHILDGREVGREKMEIGDYRLQAAIPIKYSLDEKFLKSIWADLNHAGKNAVGFKPALKKKIYASLSADNNLQTAVIAKPGSPTLKIL